MKKPKPTKVDSSKLTVENSGHRSVKGLAVAKAKAKDKPSK